jgi:hypothetical protein
LYLYLHLKEAEAGSRSRESYACGFYWFSLFDASSSIEVLVAEILP